MFTDIVGYTALSQRNEKLALQLLEKHRSLMRPVFASHKGREVKTMGDAFLVQFESALEAVECAVEMQEVIHNQTDSSSEKLEMKVGIHVGDVVQSDGDVHGDAVNIASRIEPLAKGGEICISQQVFDHVRNKVPFKLVKLEPHELKNVAVQIDVYRVELPWEEDKVTPTIGLDKHRIAVLPLVNMTSDPNDEFFADGMTEEMISTLSNIGGLMVISRTSTMQYKGAKKNLVDIGRELGAGTLLEGSVRKAGNRVRITVQLLDASEDKHLWAQSYDRELQDVFAVQSDVATNVADALKVRLLDREAAQIKKKHTESIEAYTLYLKGQFQLNRMNKEGFLGSLRLFQEAIKLDPDYARAFAGLADAYHWAADDGFVDRADGLAKAMEAAGRALELDDTLAEAHAALGDLLFHLMRYEEALSENRRAIELNPSYASAHFRYSQCLDNFGRTKEAMEEIEKASELDPLSPMITHWVGIMNMTHGRLDEAIAIFDKLIEDEPTFSDSYWSRAVCFMLKSVKERAYADFEAWGKLVRNDDAFKVKLAFLSGWFGEREKALPLIEGTIPKVGKELIRERDIADCYAVLGNKDEFFEWIDEAISAKGGFLAAYLRYSPFYDKVREDPRFPEIFKKLGLPY
jgi:adenylate cyclase